MKKFYFLLPVLLNLLAVGIYAQCSFNDVYYGFASAPVAVGTQVTIGPCIYGGEYLLLNNMIAGNTYRIETCGDASFDTQLTIFPQFSSSPLAYNDDNCGLQSSIDFIPPVTGNYRIQVNEFNCVANNVCMTLKATLIGEEDYFMTNGTINTCSGTFYDSGGLGNLYSNAEDLTFTICPDNPGDNNKTINGSQTLSGSHYGDVKVRPGATLYIDNPEVFMKSLTLKNNATVIFNQPGTLKIKGDLIIGKNGNVNVEGPSVVIYVGGEQASVQEGSTIMADIYAKDEIEVNDSGSDLTTTMVGMFIAKKLASGDNVVWGWNLDCDELDSGGGNVPFAQVSTPALAEANLTLKKDLNVYPNPTSGVVNIDITDFLGQKVEYTVYDAFGKEVVRNTINKLEIPTISLDMSSAQFANGMYQVSMKGEVEMQTVRFVLSK